MISKAFTMNWIKCLINNSRKMNYMMGEIMRHGGSNRELQIIMSTHSPFMLSDVLMEQVIKMDVDEHGCCHNSI